MLVGLVGAVRSEKRSTWNFFVARVYGWREPVGFSFVFPGSFLAVRRWAAGGAPERSFFAVGLVSAPAVGFHSYFLEASLRSGDGQQAEFLRGAFSPSGLCRRRPVGFHAYRPESFLWASLMFAVFRAGVLYGLFYVEHLGVLSGGLWYARDRSQGLMALGPFSFSS